MKINRTKEEDGGEFHILAPNPEIPKITWHSLKMFLTIPCKYYDFHYIAQLNTTLHSFRELGREYVKYINLAQGQMKAFHNTIMKS
jgi:hypothetical protein